MKNKEGFTVVEVLVVIAVIAILTVIIFPSITQIRAKNRDAEKVSDIAAIQLGLSLYYSQSTSTRGYPTDLNILVPKYVPQESLISPNDDDYIYVPLTNKVGGRCTYYHLGVKLELPSAQIDSNDDFSSVNKDSISNGYIYCGAVPTPYNGIDPNEENMYHVHP